MSEKYDSDLVQTLDALKASGSVAGALCWVKDHIEETTEIQKELVQIEAPTFHEEKRAARYAELLRAAGLEEVETDAHHNVFGWIRGKGKTGCAVVLEGHLDTVFSFGDVRGVTEDEAGRIHCPGICDDTRALAANLAVLKAFREFGITPWHDIVIAGTVCEEGLGGMKGMGWLLDELLLRTKVLATVSIDGEGAERLYANATGMADWDVTYEGPGGHAWTAFGVPSAIQAAARAAAEIADFSVTDNPKTVFTVSLIEGGQAVHAIAQRANFKVNVRSDSQKELERMNARLTAAFERGAEAENRRWKRPGQVRVRYEKVLDVPAGAQAPDARIVQASELVTRACGAEPVFMKGGCTNGNVSIGRGIPAVTLGRGGEEYGQHTLDEWFNPEGVWRCEQKSLLLLLMLAGFGSTVPALGETLV